jgi:hypothetical protein
MATRLLLFKLRFVRRDSRPISDGTVAMRLLIRMHLDMFAQRPNEEISLISLPVKSKDVRAQGFGS